MHHRLALVVLLLLVSSPTREAPQDEPQLYEGVALDATLLRLDKQALDEAYRQQLVKLFSNWLLHQAPKEAREMQKGLWIARRAYNQAAMQIARREQQLLDQRAPP
jgi:hypothetical protein